MSKGQGKRRERKLVSKLTGVVLAMVSVVFFLIFVIVLYISYEFYRQQEIDNQQSQLDRAAAQILTLQTTAENLGTQIIYDDVILTWIEMEEESTGAYLYAKRNAQSKLANYSFIIDGVQEIMLYTNDGRMVSSKDVKQPFYPEENAWYQEFLASGKKSGFSVAHDLEVGNSGNVVEVISYIMSYYSVGNTSEELGKMIISIEVAKIEELMTLESSMLTGYGLFNGEQTELISVGELKLSCEEALEEAEDGIVQMRNRDIVLLSSNMNDGWKLLLEISGSSLMRKSLSNYSWLPAAFVLLIVVLLLNLQAYIRKTVSPIHQLSEAVTEVGRGNFDTSVEIQTGDELETLAETFNGMVVDIRDLMRESVEHEKVLHNMQIENLMLQINPHFIYNTMNSIVYMARMGGNPQIADFANAFIALLQSTLRVRDSVYSTAGSELATVENYVHLQSYRYVDKFDYRVECEEDLKDCQILNVMLQPAVENAIFHGLAPKEEKGELTVTVHRRGQTLEVRVRDNGVGMSKETLEEMMKPEYIQRGGVRKIGVANVRERIRNIYGAPYDLTIESEQDVGTTVTMTVPWRKQE